MTTITLPNFCESVWNLFQHFSSAVSLLQFPQLGTQLDSVLALHWTIANNVSNVIFSIFLVDINYRQVMKLSYSSTWKWFWVVVQNTSWNSVWRMPDNIIFWVIFKYTDFPTYQFSRFNSLTFSSMWIAKEVLIATIAADFKSLTTIFHVESNRDSWFLHQFFGTSWLFNFHCSWCYELMSEIR